MKLMKMMSPSKYKEKRIQHLIEQIYINKHIINNKSLVKLVRVWVEELKGLLK